MKSLQGPLFNNVPFPLRKYHLTYPQPLHSPGTIVEASPWRNSMNISKSVICVCNWSTNWLFILSGLTIWPTAESTWAFSSSSVSLSMLSTFKLSLAFNCSTKIEYYWKMTALVMCVSKFFSTYPLRRAAFQAVCWRALCLPPTRRRNFPAPLIGLSIDEWALFVASFAIPKWRPSRRFPTVQRVWVSMQTK